MSTEAQINANRINSQSSTGPTTDAGKAKVSLNALKTGLTGRTVVLPFEDASAYEKLMLDYQKQFEPVGPIETGLVQSLVDVVWRLERIPGLQYALLKIGFEKLQMQNADIAKHVDLSIIEFHIRRQNEKDFKNLELQENRLVSRRNKEMKELAALQAARKAKELGELNRAAQAALVAEVKGQTFNLVENGFEFSKERFAAHMASLTPAMKQKLLKDAKESAEALASAA